VEACRFLGGELMSGIVEGTVGLRWLDVTVEGFGSLRGMRALPAAIAAAYFVVR
jgi:hypothetical protein